jgi:hypothetical protein
MANKRPRREWTDPNREGQSKGREAERVCAKCGNTVRQTRIFKSLNLCEYCINELREKRDGITSCRGCGKIEPLELKEHNGYCTECICSACGKPDPGYVRKTGLCFQCAVNLGDFCRSCGKEAAAQVRKNKGFCDDCVAGNRHKALGRHRRSTGYPGKPRNAGGTKTGNLNFSQKRATVGKVVIRDILTESKTDAFGKGKMFAKNNKRSKSTVTQKPGLKSSFDASERSSPGIRTKPRTRRSPKPLPVKNKNTRARTESRGRYS